MEGITARMPTSEFMWVQHQLDNQKNKKKESTGVKFEKRKKETSG